MTEYTPDSPRHAAPPPVPDPPESGLPMAPVVPTPDFDSLPYPVDGYDGAPSPTPGLDTAASREPAVVEWAAAEVSVPDNQAPRFANMAAAPVATPPMPAPPIPDPGEATGPIPQVAAVAPAAPITEPTPVTEPTPPTPIPDPGESTGPIPQVAAVAPAAPITEPTPVTEPTPPTPIPDPGEPTGPIPQVAAPPVAAEPAPPVEPAPVAPSAPSERDALLAVRAEVAKAVVGQDAAVAGILVALLCRGHVLLEGVPGVAKTLLVRAISESLSVETKRVQFTPDLMPGDLTGSLVFDAKSGDFVFRPGPVFTNILLADEINRTPPKTQSALLEAMEERQVSVDGDTLKLPSPFLVAATQNPVEYEGTYPLPEAQLDRFLVKVILSPPARDEEIEIIGRHAGGFDPHDLAGAGVRAVATPDMLEAAIRSVEAVTASSDVVAYIVDIAQATRRSPSLALGLSPRGATALLRTARAWAWLSGRSFVTPDDVKDLAHATIDHRLSLRPEAELEGITVSSVLDSVLAAVPVPR